MARCVTMAQRAGALAILGIGLVVSACGITLAPSPTSAQVQLQQARQAVAARDAAAAMAALDRAENIWLSANTFSRNPFVSPAPDVLREMGQARSALRLRRWDDAARLIDAAMRDPTTLRGT